MAHLTVYRWENAHSCGEADSSQAVSYADMLVLRSA